MKSLNGCFLDAYCISECGIVCSKFLGIQRLVGCQLLTNEVTNVTKDI